MAYAVIAADRPSRSRARPPQPPVERPLEAGARDRAIAVASPFHLSSAGCRRKLEPARDTLRGDVADERVRGRANGLDRVAREAAGLVGGALAERDRMGRPAGHRERRLHHVAPEPLGAEEAEFLHPGVARPRSKERLRGLPGEAVARAAPVVPKIDPTLTVRLRRTHPSLRTEPAEVHAMREADQVPGESVPPDVRGLPDAVAEVAGQGPGERSSHLRASRVPPTVGARQA